MYEGSSRHGQMGYGRPMEFSRLDVAIAEKRFIVENYPSSSEHRSQRSSPGKDRHVYKDRREHRAKSLTRYLPEEGEDRRREEIYGPPRRVSPTVKLRFPPSPSKIQSRSPIVQKPNREHSPRRTFRRQSLERHVRSPHRSRSPLNIRPSIKHELSSEKVQKSLDLSRSRNVHNDFHKAENSADQNVEGEIMIKNLPQETSWRDMDALFNHQIGDVTYSEMLDGGRSAIVRFKTLNHAKKAVEKMQNYKFNKKKIFLIETTAKLRKDYLIQNVKYDPGIKKDRQDRTNSSDSNLIWGNTFGLSINFLESLNIKPPLVSKIRVENLDSRIVPCKLTEIFNVAGNVSHVNIIYDIDGRSKGLAFVEYNHPVEAVQAISMLNDQIIYDRRVKIYMDHDVGIKPRLPDGVHSIGMGLGLNGTPLKNISRLIEIAEDKESGRGTANSKPVIPINDVREEDLSRKLPKHINDHIDPFRQPQSQLYTNSQQHGLRKPPEHSKHELVPPVKVSPPVWQSSQLSTNIQNRNVMQSTGNKYNKTRNENSYY